MNVYGKLETQCRYNIYTVCLYNDSYVAIIFILYVCIMTHMSLQYYDSIMTHKCLTHNVATILYGNIMTIISSITIILINTPPIYSQA